VLKKRNIQDRQETSLFDNSMSLALIGGREDGKTRPPFSVFVEGRTLVNAKLAQTPSGDVHYATIGMISYTKGWGYSAVHSIREYFGPHPCGSRALTCRAASDVDPR
jgi:hypothetical protein